MAAERPGYEKFADMLPGQNGQPPTEPVVGKAQSPGDADPGSGIGVLSMPRTPGDLSALRCRNFSPRPRSDAGSSHSMAGRMRDPRATSMPRSGGGTPGYMSAIAAAKAAQESAVMAAFRRQVECLEEKLGGQISRVQQHGDRLREAALSRVEAKLGSLESLQPRLDRKLAELSGNYKGLSDEMQAQIRRIDQMDTRLWEWRHQMEDEVRGKFSEVEQGHQQVASQIRLANATAEDSAKQLQNRLRRLEGLVEARLGLAEDVNQGLLALDARLQELEASRIQDLARSPFDALPLSLGANAGGEGPHTPVAANGAGAGGDEVLAVEPVGNAAAWAALDANVARTMQKLDGMMQEFQEIQTRLETQEERHRSLRTMMETKESEYRSNKFDRQDLERGMKELQAMVQDLDKQRLEHFERLELYQRRFEHFSKANEDMGDAIRRVQDRGFYPNAGGYPEPVPDPALESTLGTSGEDGGADLVASWAECMSRLGTVEGRVALVSEELERVRSDSDLGPRVASLIETLRQVAPKVMDQEVCMRELHEKVGLLEARAALSQDAQKAAAGGAAADGGGGGARLAASAAECAGKARDLAASAIVRIECVEGDVARLKDLLGASSGTKGGRPAADPDFRRAPGGTQ